IATRRSHLCEEIVSRAGSVPGLSPSCRTADSELHPFVGRRFTRIFVRSWRRATRLPPGPGIRPPVSPTQFPDAAGHTPTGTFADNERGAVGKEVCVRGSLVLPYRSSLAEPGRVARRDRWLAVRLQQIVAPAGVRVELWDGTSPPFTGDEVGQLVVRDRGALAGLVFNPDI